MREPIAIVGMACRFPGQVTDTHKLWELMMEARDVHTEAPAERFNQSAFYHPDSKANGTFHAKGGHFLHEDISRFDAAFFNIAPAEAKAMDPQLRLLLEVSYEAFENGGFTLDQVKGSNTGVYTALYNRDYEKIIFRDPENLPFYTTTGNGEAMFSNRLSYFFDLQGPSFTLDTGCSGSLVALQNACTSLWAGETEQSIVAASNLILDPAAMIGPSFMQFLSKDGHSYSFDSRGCGYGRGEGTACVILKPLSKALSDGDNIRSIIRSCVTNQDGRTQGITMPDLNAQKSLIEKAYSMAQCDPRNTVYAEAHGSGTAAGDYTESAALGAVLGSKRSRYDPLLIGSVKTNIGHLENVSGLASLIKATLIIEHGCIPPNTNFESPNSNINFNQWNLNVATAAHTLSHTSCRQISISSFGYGGTNSHVVLDKPPAQNGTAMSATGQAGRRLCRERATPGYLFVFSARSKASSAFIASRIQEHLNKTQCSSPEFMRSLAHTLCKRRSHFQWRHALVADSVDELQSSLQHGIAFHHSPTTPKPCFIFTGQGSQWCGMGKELFQSNSVFRDSILAAERHLLCLGAEWRLTDELLSSPETSSINQAKVAQPACTAIQLALVNLLSSLNVKPHSVVGHSSGEIAAAYACDAISFNDALLASYARGLCAAEMASKKEVSGGMLAAGLSEDGARRYLNQVEGKSGSVKIACINSPKSVTLSGDEAAIVELHKLLQMDQMFVRRLPVDVAYHSHHMERVAQNYHNALVKMGKPTSSTPVSFFSSVVGTLVDKSILDRDYWVKNLVSPVLFSQAIDHLCQEFSAAASSELVILEIGPHAGLKGPIKQCLEGQQEITDFHYSSMLVRNQSARRTTLAAAGEIFVRGCDIDLDMVNFASARDRPQVIADLPPYPWDHSTSYWHESRLSRNYRKRQDAPHDLLGVPAPDSSIFEPRWRKYIRLSEMPWLEGHKVQNRIIFPGAGWLSMAFEAGARYSMQSTSEANKIASITLSEVSFTQPLILSDPNELVEVMFVLRPSGNYNGRDLSHRHEFITYSCPHTTKVIEHCRGFVAISSKHVPSAPTNLICEGSERNAMRNILPSEFYDEVQRSYGLEYSGCFSGISSIVAGVGSSRTTITTSKVQQNAFIQPWGTSFHPATLDACMQSVLPAVLAEPGKKKPLVLSGIKQVTLIPPSSKTGTELEATYNVTCGVTRQRKDVYCGTLSMESNGQNDLVLSISSLTISEMDGVHQSTSSQSATEAQKVEKYLDPILLSVKDTERICYATTDEASIGPELNAYARACNIFAKRCLDQLQEDDLQRLQPFHLKYLRWLEGAASRQINEHPRDPDDEAAFLTSIEKKGSIGKGICRIGSNLPKVLRGEEEALALLMSDSLLQGIYMEDPGMQRCSLQAAEYARLLGLKNPNLRILEIGAGTGSATLPILDALTGGKRNLFQHYTFTDISSGFFPKAMEKFSKWKDSMTFQALNIEEAPETQNFDLESYDLIIAANVLHATAQIKRTMSHVRSLLKPGGSLLLIESTKPTTYRSFIFGTLPGWWLGSSERKWDGPILTVEEWDYYMKETGFGGAEACTHAYKRPDEQIDSLIISQAVPAKGHFNIDSILLVLSDRQFHGSDGGFGRHLAVTIARTLSIHEESIIRLGDPRANGKICICLAGLEESILVGCKESDFISIKDTLQNANTIVWVTQGATDTCSRPDSSLAIGLLRVCRRENPTTRAITVDLDADSNRSVDEVAMCLLRFIERLHLSGDDREWIERGGQWFLPRLVTDDLVSSVISNDNIASLSQALQVKSLREATRPRPLRLAVGYSKTLQDMHFIEDTSFNVPLAEDEIELEVKATGINFRDTLIMLGVLDSVLMGECSGIIRKVGGNWSHRLQPGDRVYTCYVAGHATRVRTKGSLTYPIPQPLSFTEAAAMPLVYATVYYSLVEVARLKPGESVLIHAGAGGVGQAAIVLSQHIGAVIYATVGSQEKKNLLIERYGIPDDHIFSSRDDGFAAGIQKATKGAGVDVVLNSLTGHLLQSSMDVLAVFGRFVELGKSDASSHARMDMSVFSKPVSFTSVDLLALSISRPRDILELYASVGKLVAEGIFTPPSPVRAYPVSQIEQAFRKIQTGKHMGKFVLTYEQDATVKVAPHTLEHTGLKQDASYLIIGGQGGLGREICVWMARNGAKHLVILSPSGAAKPTVQTLKDELSKMGTELHAMGCDVGNAEQLQSALSVCRSDLPPIQGVIFAPVSLRDTVFEDMMCKDYLHVLNCKMVGLLHLHHALQQQSLDFFVILSSYSGLIGNPGQANYAAASTFQDAFARWRTRQGLPTRSIDMGIIEGAGYVHDNPEATKHLQRSGTATVPLSALLSLLEYAICCPPDTSTSSQIAIGWKPGRDLDASVDQSLFSHIISAKSKSFEDEPSTFTSPEELLRTALDMAKSQTESLPQLEAAIAQYVSNALGVPIEDVDPLKSMSHHGGDSLILVEFRNWIEKGVGSPLDIGKDLGQVPLRELARLIAKSVDKGNVSNEVTAVIGTPQTRKGLNVLPKNMCNGNGSSIPSPSPSASVKMPPLLLPSLDKTIERYISTARHLVSEENWLVTSQKAKELLGPKGTGAELQKQLQSKMEDPNTRNWLDGIYAEVRYLRDRRPLVPYSSFFGVHDAESMGSSHLSSAPVVAATISSSAFQFKQLYEKGKLPQDVFFDRPVCMEAYKWLFNAYRTPALGQDSQEKWESLNHLVAMRNGNAFKIPLLVGERPASVDELTLTFQQVIQLGDSMQASAVGVLTNDNRDTWSKCIPQNRKILQQLNDSNAASVQDIETSDFMVCLDRACPQTPKERMSQIWNATEPNRWYGKSLQFVICDNGVSGFIGEHSLIDGMEVRYLTMHMQERFQNHRAGDLDTESTYPHPIPLPILMNEALDSHVETLSLETASRLRDFRISIFDIEQYGSQGIRQIHFSPGAYVNIVAQLAFHRLYGHSVPGVEAVSTSCYFRGRLDFCRLVTDDSIAFCQAMENCPNNREKCRLLFNKAAAAHVKNLTAVRNGEGIDMHFLALTELARACQESPSLFMDPTFRYSRSHKVSMTSLHHLHSEIGVFPMTDDGWRVAYLMEENR
ncbi:polyketide synthase [Aspergillus sclerotialis]|uniref:Polyketide synthase n=1 Tax=Aspergillus sclerotialis TaxID=2070753 RepID=A0A3A2Z870_9EURO|nr:polyketide synthase [Aspergillus sclerotialis]